MCGAELVELCRRCVPSDLDWEQLSTFQALLYISARTVARAGLFMKRQVKCVTSEGCGLKSQGHFQVANIINSDWIGEVLQLQYCYVTLIRCVCVCVCQAIRRYRQLVWFVLKTAEQNIRSGTEQATCFGHHQAITENIRQQSLNTAVPTA